MKNKLALLLVLLLAMTGGAADYQPALAGYQFQFPRDYFNHPNYQTEWWYYTGNVRSASGRRFGFELTFFREGVSQRPNSSPWYVHNLYMAHLALSDLSGGHYYHAERIDRAGPGIAGINEAQDLIWNGNWRAHIHAPAQELSAEAQDFAIDLNLISQKPVVIQGQNGISRKAEGAGHASHYFSLTRLLTGGTIQLKGKVYRVEGSSWMDHEFFSGSMASDESGWDWVGLQLDDNTELMLYRLLHKDGTVDPYSSGSFVDAQGHSTFLPRSDFNMTPEGEHWTSPATKAEYPLRWKIVVPRLDLQITITTPLQSQELTSKFGPSYWEGAVNVTGQRAGNQIHGVGYLEMTGYAADANHPLP